MRASTSSFSGCCTFVNVRVSPGKRVLVTSSLSLFVPKNDRIASSAALSSPMWPDGCSGYGAVISAVHVGSAAVAGLPSSSAPRIACHGRQKSKWYLSFQTLIAASADARLSSANSSALSPRSSPRESARPRAAPFHSHAGPPAVCQKMALCVCSAERTVLETEPSAFVSFTSTAYAVLSSACGPSLRNCDDVRSRNGFTFATHAVGSSCSEPSGLSSGCQCPGLAFETHGDGPKRPSFVRAASIASAAAVPAATPASLAAPFGTAASEAAYSFPRLANSAVRFGNAIVAGTVDTMFDSTL